MALHSGGAHKWFIATLIESKAATNPVEKFCHVYNELLPDSYIMRQKIRSIYMSVKLMKIYVKLLSEVKNSCTTYHWTYMIRG